MPSQPRKRLEFVSHPGGAALGAAFEPTLPPNLDVPLSRKRRWRYIDTHNIANETADLSEEEEDIDEQLREIREQGFDYLVPIGRVNTQQEERVDANLDSASSSEAHHSERDDASEAADQEMNDDLDDDEDVGLNASDMGGSDNMEEEEEDMDAGLEDLDDDDDDGPEDYEPGSDPDDSGNFPVDPRQLAL